MIKCVSDVLTFCDCQSQEHATVIILYNITKIKSKMQNRDVKKEDS